MLKNIKLPLKMMVARSLCDGAGKSCREIMAELAPLYGAERQFTAGTVEQHLLALKAVGIVDSRETIPDGEGGFLTYYVITTSGLDKVLGTG